MKRWSLSFALLAVVNILTAQQTPWSIKGRVLNEAGEGLPGATVAADETGIVFSDTTGSFMFSLKERPRELVVRRLGYFPQRIRLDTLQWDNRRATIQFSMTPEATNLGEVTISSRPIETIFRENYTTDLLDYLFAGPNLLLLVREKKKHFLRLSDNEGRLLSELLLPDNTTMLLHRSCTGGFHVCGSQWAWEVSLAGGIVDTFTRYSAAGFHGFIEPCSAQKDGYYFFRKAGPFNQSVHYFYFDPSGERHPFITITDSLSSLAAWHMYSDLASRRLFMLERTYETSPGNPFSAKHPDFVVEDLPFARYRGEKAFGPAGLMQLLTVFNDDQPAYLSALEGLRSDSVYAPMYLIKDTIFLFNHVQNTLMRVVTEPFQIRCSDIVFHHGKGWRKQIMVDEPMQRVYGRFFSAKTGLMLKEIDLHTGQAEKVYSIPVAPYLAVNYQIRNGILYFIGQPNVSNPNRQLYKVQIFRFQVPDEPGK